MADDGAGSVRPRKKGAGRESVLKQSEDSSHHLTVPGASHMLKKCEFLIFFSILFFENVFKCRLLHFVGHMAT